MKDFVVRNKLEIAIMVFLMTVLVVTLSGCREAEKVSYNISLEADNFNTIRQITVINCIKGDVLFQMTGKMSIKADTQDNQLEVTVEDEYGRYRKHFIGLSDNVTYVVEDITDTPKVSGSSSDRPQVLPPDMPGSLLYPDCLC